MIQRRTSREADRITRTVWLAALAVPSVIGLAGGWKLTSYLLDAPSPGVGMSDQVMYFIMFGMGWGALSFALALSGFLFTGLFGAILSAGYHEVDEYPAGPVVMPLPGSAQKAQLNQALVEDLQAWAQTSPQAKAKSEAFLSQGMGAYSFHLRDFHWAWHALSKAGIESRSEKLYEEIHS